MIYIYTPAPDGTLTHAPQTEIPPAAWQNLAANVAQEAALSPYPARVLAARLTAGRAGVVWSPDDRQIVHYSSLIQVIDAEIRLRMAGAVGITLPPIDIYEGATGWTHPDWRGRGLAMFFRRTLYAAFRTPSAFIMTMTVGIGASPLLLKLDWRLVGWDHLPYLSSLFAWRQDDGAMRHVGPGWEVTAGKVPYLGDHVHRLDAHDWPRYYHLWVSDWPVARRFNDQLGRILGGDLPRWRDAVSAVENDLYRE
ncbi:MAG: hypothetical protein EA396_10210 [Anaerolineaceae bacterium]|nr:MAG: hypothetical protein EA396_10210 [Anaerolineaceae bacterium]